MERIYVKTRGSFLDKFFKNIYTDIKNGNISGKWKHTEHPLVIDLDRRKDGSSAYRQIFGYHETDEVCELKINQKFESWNSFAEYYMDCSSELADEIEQVLKEMMKLADCGHCLKCTMYALNVPLQDYDGSHNYIEFYYDGDGSDRIIEFSRIKIFDDYRKISDRQNICNRINYCNFLGREVNEYHLSKLDELNKDIMAKNAEFSKDAQKRLDELQKEKPVYDGEDEFAKSRSEDDQEI